MTSKEDTFTTNQMRRKCKCNNTLSFYSVSILFSYFLIYDRKSRSMLRARKGFSSQALAVTAPMS